MSASRYAMRMRERTTRGVSSLGIWGSGSRQPGSGHGPKSYRPQGYWPQGYRLANIASEGA